MPVPFKWEPPLGLAETLIISDITKNSSNNCLLLRYHYTRTPCRQVLLLCHHYLRTPCGQTLLLHHHHPRTIASSIQPSQEFFLALDCVHFIFSLFSLCYYLYMGTTIMPPRDLASWPKPWRDNYEDNGCETKKFKNGFKKIKVAPYSFITTRVLVTRALGNCAHANASSGKSF